MLRILDSIPGKWHMIINRGSKKVTEAVWLSTIMHEASKKLMFTVESMIILLYNLYIRLLLFGKEVIFYDSDKDDLG